MNGFERRRRRAYSAPHAKPGLHDDLCRHSDLERVKRTCAATLAALVPAAVDGLVREVIVVDGGSTDGRPPSSIKPAPICRERSAGAAVSSPRAPARRAFPGCCSCTPTPCLEAGWEREAIAFMEPHR